VVRYEIGGMTGAGDAERARKAAAGVPGVLAVEIDLVTEVATLAVDPERFEGKRLVATLATVGYEAAPRTSSVAVDPAAGDAALRLGAKALGGALLLGVVGWIAWPPVAAATLALGAAGVALVARRARRAALDAQALLASGLLLAGGVIALARGTPGAGWAGAAALAAAAFLPLARWIEARALGVAASAMAGLEPLPPTILRPGERVRAGAGALIPVDGVVLSGSATVDETASGGAPAAARARDDGVVAGTRITGGSLVIEARRVGPERALARVRAALTTVQESSSPTVRFAALAEKLAPPVALAGAIVAALAQLLAGRPLLDALAAAAAVLVAVSPLAAALATPAARAVAAARAASRGVFFRNAEALERVAAVTALFVDKSATLIQGRRQVVGVATSSREPVELVALAAAAEQATPARDAPLARALRDHAEAHGRLVPPAEHAAYSPGKGVTATVAGVAVAVGSRRMAETAGIAPAELEKLAAGLPRAGAVSPLYVLVDGKLAGAIALEEPLRAGAAEFVAAVSGRGVRVALLTGDEAAPAAAIAEAAGIAPGAVHAGLGPDDKKRAVAAGRASGDVVAVAGDSVDDAAALAAADVGIALARGVELELSSGGVTVLRGHLDGVVAALDLARRARWAMLAGAGLAVVAAAVVALVAAILPLGLAVVPVAVTASLGVLAVELAAAALLRGPSGDRVS
jgi:Cu+-exporting ATPase